MPITSSFQPMFNQESNVTNNLAVSLLTHYSFDLGGYSASELVKRWENQYPSNWVHLGIIEALYQGRYKAVSVQQILTLWLRRNHPSYHFNMEFERLICNKLPEDLRWNSLPPLQPALPSLSGNPTIKDVMRNYQSSQKSDNLSYQINTEWQQTTGALVQDEDYHVPELGNTEAEENSIARPVSKALPTASSMVFVPQPESQTSTSITETRSYVGTEPQVTLEEEQPQTAEKSFISKTLAKLLPPERNHPPIEQFTPEKSDSSDTFTSKLKGVMG